MECRVKIAALHYNENAGRAQHKNQDGKLAFKIRYPKYKKGGYIVRKVLEDRTYNYIEELWNQVVNQCQKVSQERKAAAQAITLPPTLCANYPHPDKETAIREHNTRYLSRQ